MDKKHLMRLCLTGVFVVSAVFSLFPGCGRKEADTRIPGGEKRYERIVCMSPSVTEIVFALGQGDRVVGVSDYTTYPPEADHLPRCGGHLNPNYEILLSLEPDLIIAHGAGEDMKEFGRRYGITVMPLEISDLESIYGSAREIAEVLDAEAEGRRMIAEMRRGLEEITRGLENGTPVDTLLVVGRDPSSLREVHVVGPGGFLHDLLELVGGRNIMGDLGRQYSTVSKEIVAQREPEVIIELHGEGMMEDAERRKYLEVWQDMSSLPAVRNNRICVIEETFALLPGPRSVQIAGKMAECLHGDAP